MPTDALSFAQALIRCRSVTPADDGALAVAAEALAGAGFEVHRPVFSAPGMPDVANLFARIGRDGPSLVFAGHTDVVPAGDAAGWTHDPFGGAVADGVLYGRGAVDMKGAVAAMLAAALAFLEARGPDFGGAIAFLLTGDEEGPAVNGTAKLLDWAKARGERFEACLLGEPTNPEALGDTIKVGRRGSLTGRLAVRGRQGHVAYPHLALNPIPVLARMVGALSGEPLDGGTAHFAASNLEWTTLDVGNPATNVVPAEARGTFNVRFNDLWTPASLACALRERLDRAAGDAAWTLDVDPTNSVAFLTEAGPFVALVQDAVAAETGRRPELSTSGGTSDARFIKDHCPVVEFGLVGRTMHAVDECVPVADLARLTAIYRRVLEARFPPAGGRAPT